MKRNLGKYIIIAIICIFVQFKANIEKMMFG